MAEAEAAIMDPATLNFSELHINLAENGNVALVLEHIGMNKEQFCGAIRTLTQQFLGAWHPELPALMSELYTHNDINPFQRAEHFFTIFFGQSYFYPKILLQSDHSPQFYACRQARVELAIQKGLQNTAMTRRQYDLLEEEVRSFCKDNIAPRNKEDFNVHMEKFFENMNSNLQEGEEEVDSFDLEIFGQIDFFLQQGPHAAILAVLDGWNDSAQEYFPLDEFKSFPTNGQTIAKAYYGPVQKHKVKNEYIISKTISLKKLERNRNSKQKFNDYPPNEIATHRYLCEHYKDCPGHTKSCPSVISLKGVTKEEAGQRLFYYMEFGRDYFSHVSNGYEKYSREWKKWLRKQPNARQIKAKQKSPWELARCKDFMRLAKGLQFMHKLGIAHRDFKLENIVLGLDGNVKIIDFGVAHRFGFWERDNFSCNDRVGTATYMSPECYVANSENRKSDVHLLQYKCWNAVANDVWTLGIALFMMLFACPPYDLCSNSDTRFMFLTAGKYVPKHKKAKIPRNASLRALVKAYQRHQMITDDCLSFLELFFLPEPDRMTLDEVWKHPWVADVLEEMDRQEKKGDPSKKRELSKPGKRECSKPKK